MNSAALLSTRNLAVAASAHGPVLCADLSLEVRAGERLAILGRNGAGKSSLLTVLAGLAPARSGQVLLEGLPYTGRSAKANARLRGFLPQKHVDAFDCSVMESCLTGRHPYLDRWAWESDADLEFARTALNFVGLSGLEERSIQSLSGGERQRLAVATLLTQEPDLYLLDEPLAHLDLNHAIAVLNVFSACAGKGAGVVMVLHEPGLAARFCDRVLLLYGDGQHELGPCADLLTENRLTRLYGHPMRVLDDEGRPWFVPA